VNNESVPLIVAFAAIIGLALVIIASRRSVGVATRQLDVQRADLQAQLARADARSTLLIGPAAAGQTAAEWWEYDTITGEVTGAAESWLRLRISGDPQPHHLVAGPELLHPDDCSKAWAMIDGPYEGLRSETLRLVHDDLPTRWIEVTSMPMAEQPHRLVGVTLDVTAQKVAESDLLFRLENDELTGCANRAGLTRVLRQTLAAGQPFALLLIDLDHFADVNVTLGHPVGDHVLVSVARRFSWTLRRHDLLARLGGDEFAVLVRASAADGTVDATAAAAELVEVLAIPVEVNGLTIRARASVGVVVAPEDGDDVDTLLRRADLALHRAKERGGTWARFEADDEAAAARRLQLSESLPIALADPPSGRAEFEVHFQPIIELVSGGVRSVEALARWQHPLLGAIPPTEFVALAERCGLGLQLFRAVLGRSLGQLALWRSANLLDSIAVNVSPCQLIDQALFGVVADALILADLPPNALTLEITENALIESGEATATLRRLHELGVRLAIDDFGTGYSSLSNLLLLHIDVLKLDRSFVMGLATEPRHASLVSLAVGTAHRLGLTVVAEGVEDAETLATLRQHDCDSAQGYHIARPAPANVITEWLERRHRSGVAVRTVPADHAEIGPSSRIR
jgi:diguanylate cyclase (GGDEF)-like protein